MLSFPKESLCVRRNEITKINKLFCECYQISPAPADRPLNKYPLLIKAMADECDRFLNIEKNNLSERADLIGPHMRMCGNQSLGSDKCVVRWAQLAVNSVPHPGLGSLLKQPSSLPGHTAELLGCDLLGATAP